MHLPLSQAATCDYVSLTLRDAALVETMYQRGIRFLTHESKLGYVTREADMHGYHLLRAGGVQVGRSAVGAWVTLIGERAEAWYDQFMNFGAQATRIDLAVTAEYFAAEERLASREYDRLMDEKAHTSKRKYALVRSQNDGETLYVGSRKSDTFGRLYDRGVKSRSHDSGKLWRWEVEYKQAKAGAVWSGLTGGAKSSTMAAGLVSEWFSKRGVVPPATTETYVLDPVEYEKFPTVENKLEWLRQQVRPSVERLIAAGFFTETCKSLGILKGGS